MYAQVEKYKKSQSRAVANSVTQKKSNVKQGLGFVDNREKTYQLKRSILQLKVKTFSSLNDDNKEEAKSSFWLYKSLAGLYLNDEGVECVNDIDSVQVYLNLILDEHDVQNSPSNRKELLHYVGVKLVDPSESAGIDMSQFVGSTYSCLPGQLNNIIGNKTQGLLSGQSYNGNQMYHISGRYPSVGKPVWVIESGKVKIIGMYTHPGENFKQYKLLQGIGPNSFTIS